MYVELVRSLGAAHVFDYTREDSTQSRRRDDLIVADAGNHAPPANRRDLSLEGILVILGGPKGDWLGPLMLAGIGAVESRGFP